MFDLNSFFHGMLSEYQQWGTGSHKIQFWEDVPFRLNVIIDITQALRYTNMPPPNFVDNIYDMPQLLQEELYNHYELWTHGTTNGAAVLWLFFRSHTLAMNTTQLQWSLQ